jgi:hypothetical protein
MMQIMTVLKARVSYSQGYRATQIFDEDLHIETSEKQIKLTDFSAYKKYTLSFLPAAKVHYNL